MAYETGLVTYGFSLFGYDTRCCFDHGANANACKYECVI